MFQKELYSAVTRLDVERLMNGGFNQVSSLDLAKAYDESKELL